MGKTEIHQASALREPVADRGRDRRPLFEDLDPFREGVPIPRHDSQGTEAASELTLQVSHPQGGQTAHADLLRLRVVPEPRADRDLSYRAGKCDGACAPGIVGAKAGVPREPLERLGAVE